MAYKNLESCFMTIEEIEEYRKEEFYKNVNDISNTLKKIHKELEMINYFQKNEKKKERIKLDIEDVIRNALQK